MQVQKVVRATAFAVMSFAAAGVAGAADVDRNTGVGDHIAFQGNQALMALQLQAVRQVAATAEQGLHRGLVGVRISRSVQISSGGGAVTPRETAGASYSHYSACPSE